MSAACLRRCRLSRPRVEQPSVVAVSRRRRVERRESVDESTRTCDPVRAQDNQAVSVTARDGRAQSEEGSGRPSRRARRQNTLAKKDRWRQWRLTLITTLNIGTGNRPWSDGTEASRPASPRSEDDVLGRMLLRRKEDGMCSAEATHAGGWGPLGVIYRGSRLVRALRPEDCIVKQGRLEVGGRSAEWASCRGRGSMISYARRRVQTG